MKNSRKNGAIFFLSKIGGICVLQNFLHPKNASPQVLNAFLMPRRLRQVKICRKEMGMTIVTFERVTFNPNAVFRCSLVQL